MKKLYVQLGEGHTEICGYFFQQDFIKKEFFSKQNSVYNLEIFVYYPFKNSCINWFNYYSKLLNIPITYVQSFNSKQNSVYDEIVFLTSRDFIDIQCSGNITLIHHIIDDYISCLNLTQTQTQTQTQINSINHLTVSPFINECSYIMPVVDMSLIPNNDDTSSTVIKINSLLSKKIIGVVGLSLFNKQYRTLNIISLSKQYPDHNIILFARQNVGYDVLSQLNSLINVTVITDSPPAEMISILKQTDCLFANETEWYYSKTLSGIIPLSIILNKPLICSDKLVQIYSKVNIHLNRV